MIRNIWQIGPALMLGIAAIIGCAFGGIFLSHYVMCHWYGPEKSSESLYMGILIGGGMGFFIGLLLWRKRKCREDSQPLCCGDSANNGSIRLRFSLKFVFLVFALLSPLCALIGIIAQEPSRQYARGRKAAELDWRSDKAVIHVPREHSSKYIYQSNGFLFTHRFDSETGLAVLHERNAGRHHPQFFAGYKARIKEILNHEGTSSSRSSTVADKELLDAFASTTANAVEQFPHEVSNNIVLLRPGPNDSITIDAPNLLLGLGPFVRPVTVERLRRDPDIFLIRNGDTWVCAFHEDGNYLASAVKW